MLYFIVKKFKKIKKIKNLKNSHKQFFKIYVFAIENLTHVTLIFFINVITFVK